MNHKHMSTLIIIFISASLMSGCMHTSQTQKDGENKINNYSQIKIIYLEKKKVASYCFQYSRGPEAPAVKKITTFAKENDILKNKPQFYGFNNPDPFRSPMNPEYGYESWVTVDNNVKGNDEIEIKESQSGEYLAMYGVSMDEAWSWLINTVEGTNYNSWIKESGYEYDQSRQWLDWQIFDESKYPEFVETKIIMLFPIKMTSIKK